MNENAQERRATILIDGLTPDEILALPEEHRCSCGCRAYCLSCGIGRNLGQVRLGPDRLVVEDVPGIGAAYYFLHRLDGETSKPGAKIQ